MVVTSSQLQCRIVWLQIEDYKAKSEERRSTIKNGASKKCSSKMGLAMPLTARHIYFLIFSVVLIYTRSFHLHQKFESRKGKSALHSEYTVILRKKQTAKNQY